MPRGDNLREMWKDDPERMRFFSRKGRKKYDEISRKNARTPSRTLRATQASSVRSRGVVVTLAPVNLED